MPTTPYIIYGIVYEKATVNPSVNNTITIVNESSNDSFTVRTNSQGQFVADLANFRNGFSDNDYIRISAIGSGSLGTDLRFKSVCKREQVQISELNIQYEV